MNDGTGSELIVAVNPNTASKLAFLLLVPYRGGLLLGTTGTWPRAKSLYCRPLPPYAWPESPQVLDRCAMLSCERRGSSIDLVLDRARENRSQLVFTTCRGREAVFWQSMRCTTQYRARPLPPASAAAGITRLEIIVDTREQEGYDFSYQPVRVVRHKLACGDYGVGVDGRLAPAVERKSIPDLASSLADRRLEYALAHLAAVPHAAVVVEDDYSQLFALEYLRENHVADRLARLQVHYPAIPIVFTGTRGLAEEWVYRFLSAAREWVVNEPPARARVDRVGLSTAKSPAARNPVAYSPSESAVRAWARTVGLAVAEGEPIRAGIWASWRRTHPHD